MRKSLLLPALALALTACGPHATPALPIPEPTAEAPALFELSTDAAVLARTGLSITLIGRALTLKETTTPLSVRLKLPDGSYSPATGGAGGQSLATAQYIAPVALGTVVEVGQAFFEPVATVTLKQ